MQEKRPEDVIPGEFTVFMPLQTVFGLGLCAYCVGRMGLEVWRWWRERQGEAPEGGA